MQQLSNRMLNGSEKGLIVDFDTIYMDTIRKVVRLATLNAGWVKPFYHDHTKLQLISLLSSSLDDDYISLLFEAEHVAELEEEYYRSPNYDREDPEFLTDIGFTINSFVSHPIQWFVIRERLNENFYPVFKDKEIITEEIEIDDILAIVKSNNISVIIVPTAEMVARLAAELKDVTIVYPTYGCNMVEAIPGAFFFKHYETLDTYESVNKLEVVKFNPIGRYIPSSIAMG